jgi:hypothetical protein
MDESDDLNVLALHAVVCVLASVSLFLVHKRRQQRNRTTWVRSMLQQRRAYGFQNTLLPHMAQLDPWHYKNFLRMDDPTFEDLLSRVHDVSKSTARLTQP